ncbi:MAG: hypothetical protein AUJ92_10835 [Armatimonadetes bacterium CG2_30_59_28]|nr:hypothetical protein [Armatimonadota bacterium]OIO94125.1 MAG: hypothetical protein AUJ92_10835 [Armatimonadetes bacterium CG2_30_59_28]PIU66718.1 MAG: hypothetical protein COS85_03650 [Armatimonadetes bacterium CG07_land_8_20_14_0_80_59_28]PIX42539.1 MAG: hypothetical protein COZ56_09140 [Armatimonadetes bacterium CG_4_8_14_3_um_filter_58_9]PIY42613.1 MAG: hypothetical protein COZ05_13445 [Armatimonadetes bacterium CG_4_10_14_3_um_filter_59_10]
MIVLWVILMFLAYVGLAIYWITATSHGWSTPWHIHEILHRSVGDQTEVLLFETLRVLVGGMFFYAVAEYALHKAMRKRKRDRASIASPVQ